jgi:hypothetical protein
MARVNAIGTEFVESDVDDIVRTPSLSCRFKVLMIASNSKYPSDSLTQIYNPRSHRMASIPYRTIIPTT